MYVRKIGKQPRKKPLPKTTRRVRLSESEIDAKSFEIVRGSMCADAGYAQKNKNGFSGLVYALSRMKPGSLSFAVKKLQNAVTKSLERANKKFAEMNAELYE